MTDSDKALWLTYGDRMTPLLKGLLKPLDINVGDIETEYTGSDYTWYRRLPISWQRGDHYRRYQITG